jgi:signal transduction histidine kinase
LGHHPENDTLDGIVTYLGNFFQEYVTQAGLRCWLNLPAQLPAVGVSSELRHNLFLAFKEALNNAVKHAAATEVSPQLKTQPDGFSFIIKDNGRGFNPVASGATAPEPGRTSSGHGLPNLAARLEKIGGTCQIRSAPGQGTEVELTVVLQPDRGRQAS